MEEDKALEIKQIPTDSKIRLNIKQTTKGFKYYDITVRGETIEEIKEHFTKAENYAVEIGCVRR